MKYSNKQVREAFEKVAMSAGGKGALIGLGLAAGSQAAGYGAGRLSKPYSKKELKDSKNLSFGKSMIPGYLGHRVGKVTKTKKSGSPESQKYLKDLSSLNKKYSRKAGEIGREGYDKEKIQKLTKEYQRKVKGL